MLRPVEFLNVIQNDPGFITMPKSISATLYDSPFNDVYTQDDSIIYKLGDEEMQLPNVIADALSGNLDGTERAGAMKIRKIAFKFETEIGLDGQPVAYLIHPITGRKLDVTSYTIEPWLESQS